MSHGRPLNGCINGQSQFLSSVRGLHIYAGQCEWRRLWLGDVTFLTELVWGYGVDIDLKHGHQIRLGPVREAVW